MNCPKCGKDNSEGSKFCRSCGNSLSEEVAEGDVRYLYYNRYRIIKPLRIGGMSTIYLAEDVNFDGLIYVVKEMSDVFKDEEEREYAIQKFKEEAFILAKLRHPNIPVVSNHFVENGKYYIVMDYIEGINLEDLLMDSVVKGLAEEDVVDWAVQICEILEYLHIQIPPIIHRDIKPSNFIKREPDGRIMIIDFGIARIFEPKKMGTLIGTPGYISPEQYAGQIDIRSDIFALGATMHQLLTGKDPAQGVPFDFPPLTSMRPDVSKKFEEIIEKCLQQEMDNRFATSTDLKNALISLRKPLSSPAVSVSKVEFVSKPELIPEATPEKIFGSPDKQGALKLHPDKPVGFANPPAAAPQIIPPAAAPPPAQQATSEEYDPDILESPVNFLRSVQLQSFHGKDAIKTVLDAFVGIDIGNERIKIIQFTIDDGYFIHPYGMAVAEIPPNTINDGVIVDPKTIGAFIRQIIDGQKIKARRAVVSIPQKCTKVARFFIPETATYKIKEVVLAEAKKHFTFSLDNAKIAFEVLEFFDVEQLGKLQVLVWVVEENVIKSLENAMRCAELFLWDTEFESFAVKNALEIMLRDQHKQNNVAVISLGASSSTIHMIRNSQVWLSKSFFPGGTELTSAIADRINVNVKQAENLKITKANMDISRASHIDYVLFKTIEPLISKILDELVKTIDEYEEKYRVTIPIAVLLSGGTSLLKNIDRFIERGLGLKTSVFKLPISRKLDLHKELIEELGTSFMVAFGLAMKPYLMRIDPNELEEDPLAYIKKEEEEKEIKVKLKKKSIWTNWFK